MSAAARRLARPALAALVVPILLGAVLVRPASAEEFVVEMKRFAFIPEGETLQGDVTIQAGDTVTWVYAEDPNDPTGCGFLNGPSPVPTCPGHSTTSSGGLWDSQVFGKEVPPSQVSYEGNRFSVRFDEPGTYAYVCTVHEALPTAFNGFEGMLAAVIVEGASQGGSGGGGGDGAQSLSTPLPGTGAAEGLLLFAGIACLGLALLLRRILRAQ